MPVKNSNNLLLVVEDSGIGFDMKNGDYLLGAFNKLTPAYKSQHEGLGIGLTIVQTFLHELNGSLKISSQVGKGSCFECVLPIKQKSYKNMTTGSNYHEKNDKNLSGRGHNNLPDGN